MRIWHVTPLAYEKATVSFTHEFACDFVVSPSVVRIPSQLNVDVWMQNERKTNMVCSCRFSKMVDEFKCCKYSNNH